MNCGTASVLGSMLAGELSRMGPITLACANFPVQLCFCSKSMVRLDVTHDFRTGYVNRVHISIVYPGDNHIHRQNVVLCDLSVISALRTDFTHDGSYGNRGVGKASTLGARPHLQ